MAPDGSDAGPFTPGDSLMAETMGGGGGGGYEEAAVHQGYEYGAADATSLVVADAVSGVSVRGIRKAMHSLRWHPNITRRAINSLEQHVKYIVSVDCKRVMNH